MNEQQSRRVQKLMKVNMKSEHPPELILKFVNDSIMLDNKINGMSDKEAIDVLIAKEDHEAKSVGVMYHILTCGENQELFSRMIRYINGGGVDYWHTILCNMNMALFELWQFIHWPCKEQLLRLIREGIRQNVKQIENVLMSAYRTTIGSIDYPTKIRVLNYLSSIIREFEGWFKAQKSCSGLVGCILTCGAHLIVSSQAPLSKDDTLRENMANFMHWVIKARKMDCMALGRDFILTLTRLGKLPQFEDIWKDFAQNPTSYGVSGFEECFAKPNMLFHLRLSPEIMRRIDFMLHSGGKNLQTYFSWMYSKYLRGVDAPGVRAEMIRYLVALPLDPSKYPPSAADYRVQLIHLILATCPLGADQQWLKMCLFLDWFGCDERNPANYSNVEVPLLVIRYALFLQAPPPHPNNMIQGSYCSHLANSLLEYVGKSVDVILPAITDQIRRNVNSAFRMCRDRLLLNFAQTLEHHKLDRKVTDMMRSVCPEFFRNGYGTHSSKPAQKRKPVEEKKPAPAPAEPEEVAVPEPVKKVERAASQDDNELTASLKLLKGEVKEKLEALRAGWKDLDEDADKCEAVEGVLQVMLNTEENFDDAQQEVAAQCLLGIMGSVVVEEQSLLPENEKDLLDTFSHPIYSFLRMLCIPPDDSESTSEMLTNLMVAMREKDSTLTYVLLYFIKGADVRPNECVECYREVARISDRRVEDMLASDLQMCAVNDNRLFAYLVPFVFAQFEEDIVQSADLLQTLCSNMDAVQLRSFVSEIIREEIKLFRKDSFSKIVMASVEWATTPQWVFWHLVHADGVPIEWFLSTIPKLDSAKHDEAIANILLMMKRMDREPWAGLIRVIFNRIPSKDDNFTADSLKVLIEDSEQCHKVAELVGQLIKKLLANNDIVGVGVRLPKKGNPLKLTLQQVLEHLQWFSTTCTQKKQRATESFLSRHHIQDAFSSIKTNEKATVLLKKYNDLFDAMDAMAQDSKEGSSRTLRGNRQGSGGDKQQTPAKRKATDGGDDEQNSKKRKTQKEVIELSDSDSD